MGTLAPALVHHDGALAAVQADRPVRRLVGEPLDGIGARPGNQPPSPPGAPPTAGHGASPLPPRAVSTQEKERRQALDHLREKLFPPLLGEQEIDQWAAACELGPADVETLHSLLAEYRTTMARVPSPGGASPVWRAPAEAGATRPAGPDIDESALVAGAFEWDDASRRHVARFTPIMLRLLALRAARLDAQRRAEHDLAQGFVSLADQHHQSAARRIAFTRQARVLAMPGDRGVLTVDLPACVAEAGLTPDEHAVIAVTLDAHMRNLAAALRRRATLAPVIESDLARLLVQLGPGWELVHGADDLADAQAQIDDVRRAIAELDEPIRELQLAGLAAVAKALPPSTALAVHDRFWQRARPDCFDDEAELGEIVRAAVEPRSGMALSADETAARLNLLAMTRLRLLPLGFDVAACADELATRAAPHRADGLLRVDPLVPTDATVRSDAAETLRLEIRRLDAMRRRRAICDQAATALRGMLMADEVDVLRRIAAYARDLEVRGGADAWTAARLNERLTELRRIEERRSAEIEVDVVPMSPADEAQPETPPETPTSEPRGLPPAQPPQAARP